MPESGIDPCFGVHNLLCSPCSDAVMEALPDEDLSIQLVWKTLWAINTPCHSQLHTQLLAHSKPMIIVQ